MTTMSTNTPHLFYLTPFLLPLAHLLLGLSCAWLTQRRHTPLHHHAPPSPSALIWPTLKIKIRMVVSSPFLAALITFCFPLTQHTLLYYVCTISTT